MKIAGLAVVLLACGGGQPPPPVAPQNPPAVVVPDAKQEVAPAGPTSDERVAAGKQLFEGMGCNACHTVDGTPRVGSTMAGLWGTTVELLDGSKRVVDATFIANVLREPQVYRRNGSPTVMPSYDGRLLADDVASLVAYIESLASVKPQTVDATH